MGGGESFGFGAAGAAPQYGSHLRHAGAKGGAAAADGQKAGADGQPALRRGSDDSSRELVTSVPQLGTFAAALAGTRQASQRSMHSLDDLSWARRPSGQVRLACLRVQPVTFDVWRHKNVVRLSDAIHDCQGIPDCLARVRQY